MEWKTIAVLEDHPYLVHAIAVDGQNVYSALHNGKIEVWRKNDWSKVTTLEGHHGVVFALALDDQYVYSGASDSIVRKWRKDDWKETAMLRAHSASVRSLAVDDRHIYAGYTARKTIQVWRKNDPNKTIARRGHDGAVVSLAIDGDYLYSASEDRTICVWKKKKWAKVAVLKGHTHPVNTVAVDGQYIYSGSDDKTVRVWRKDDYSQVALLKGHSKMVTAVAVDGRHLYSGSSDRTIRVWNKMDWSETAVLNEHSNIVYALAADENYMYSGSRGQNTLRVWKTLTVLSPQKIVALEDEADRLEAQGNTREAQQRYVLLLNSLKETDATDLGVTKQELDILLERIMSKRNLSMFMEMASELEKSLEELENLQARIEETAVEDLQEESEAFETQFLESMSRLREQAKGMRMFTSRVKLRMDVLELRFEQIQNDIRESIVEKRATIVRRLRYSGTLTPHDESALRDIVRLVELRSAQLEEMEPDDDESKRISRRLQENILMGINIAQAHGWKEAEKRLRDQLVQLRERGVA